MRAWRRALVWFQCRSGDHIYILSYTIKCTHIIPAEFIYVDQPDNDVCSEIHHGSCHGWHIPHVTHGCSFPSAAEACTHARLAWQSQCKLGFSHVDYGMVACVCSNEWWKPRMGWILDLTNAHAELALHASLRLNATKNFESLSICAMSWLVGHIYVHISSCWEGFKAIFVYSKWNTSMVLLVAVCYCELVCLSSGQYWQLIGLQCSTWLPWCLWVQSRYRPKFNIFQEKWQNHRQLWLLLWRCQNVGAARISILVKWRWGIHFRFVRSEYAMIVSASSLNLSGHTVQYHLWLQDRRS